MKTVGTIAVAALLLPAAAHAQRDGRALFAERCAVCHGETGQGGQGPALADIVRRRAGAARFGYSEALRGAGFTWDAAHLDRYLADPAAAVPGTTMALQTPLPAERQALIRFLATLRPEHDEANPTAPSASPSTPTAGPVLTGMAAFGDWRTDAPGVRRRIGPQDQPPPYATRSASNAPDVGPRPPGTAPIAPPGFRVSLFAQGLRAPRLIRTAPNGDVFVAESAAGRIRVLRARDGAPRAEQESVFAAGLRGPFGLAFYPPGPDPQFLFVGLNNQVVRFPYQAGDTLARGAPEVIVAQLAPTSGGHITRDLAFSADGSRMFVSVGSASNAADGIGAPPGGLEPWRQGALGAAWGSETDRADVLSFTPEGGDRRVFATGLRNCVGLAIQPGTGDLWCSTNERDGLGDNVPPDYVTRVRPGGFYGWPWRYVGDHEDPRHRGERPDLAGRMTEPDVLIQPHSASLEMTFYDGKQFPRAYWGDAFAAEHGSWNRGKRTGYKVIRIHLENGVPDGTYEDFLTGFVTDDDAVWGRPVGVTTTDDGALLVSEDASGTIWRVTWEGR